MKNLAQKQDLNFSSVNENYIRYIRKKNTSVAKGNRYVILSNILNYFKILEIKKFKVTKNSHLNFCMQMVWPGPFYITGWIKKTHFCP